MGLTAKLSPKQLRALRACVEPESATARLFWADARASWPGPRKTLGSLLRRGLVTYSHEDGWKATSLGRRELIEQTDGKCCDDWTGGGRYQCELPVGHTGNHRHGYTQWGRL